MGIDVINQFQLKELNRVFVKNRNPFQKIDLQGCATWLDTSSQEAAPYYDAEMLTNLAFHNPFLIPANWRLCKETLPNAPISILEYTPDCTWKSLVLSVDHNDFVQENNSILTGQPLPILKSNFSNLTTQQIETVRQFDLNQKAQHAGVSLPIYFPPHSAWYLKHYSDMASSLPPSSEDNTYENFCNRNLLRIANSLIAPSNRPYTFNDANSVFSTFFQPFIHGDDGNTTTLASLAGPSTRLHIPKMKKIRNPISVYDVKANQETPGEFLKQHGGSFLATPPGFALSFDCANYPVPHTSPVAAREIFNPSGENDLEQVIDRSVFAFFT